MEDRTENSQECIREATRIVPLDEIADAAEIARLDAREAVYSFLFSSYMDFWLV